jgi:DNA-binding FrmR family transcriptional regulator
MATKTTNDAGFSAHAPSERNWCLPRHAPRRTCSAASVCAHLRMVSKGTLGGIKSLDEEHAMEIDNDVKAELNRRLARIEGQVRGIQNMLSEDRECRDVVTQIAAASKALEQVGFRLLASGLTTCLQDPEKAEADGYPVAEVEKLFLKLA